MSDQGGTNIQEPGTGTQTLPQKGSPRPGLLPQFRVLLHNDEVNTIEHVIITILRLTPLNEQDALLRTVEAHETGVALLLITHQERAELYQEQFQSARLTVTIEPAE